VPCFFSASQLNHLQLTGISAIKYGYWELISDVIQGWSIDRYVIHLKQSDLVLSITTD